MAWVVLSFRCPLDSRVCLDVQLSAGCWVSQFRRDLDCRQTLRNISVQATGTGVLGLPMCEDLPCACRWPPAALLDFLFVVFNCGCSSGGPHSQLPLSRHSMDVHFTTPQSLWDQAPTAHCGSWFTSWLPSLSLPKLPTLADFHLKQFQALLGEHKPRD